MITKKITKKIKINAGFVSDYAFSSLDKIFYLQAKTFKACSPIAPQLNHDFDIYELDLATSKSKKLSNLKSYYIGEIINWKKDSLLLSMQGERQESGLFIFNKNKVFKKDLKLSNRIIIKNDTLRNSSMYSNPVILPDSNILCSSSYQIVKLDLKTKREYPILPSTGYHYSMITIRQNTIFYKQKDDTNNIYYFDLNNRLVKKLDLTILQNTP